MNKVIIKNLMFLLVVCFPAAIKCSKPIIFHHPALCAFSNHRELVSDNMNVVELVVKKMIAGKKRMPLRKISEVKISNIKLEEILDGYFKTKT